MIANPSFESGMQDWQRKGGTVDTETCCGQHETPFWGTLGSPYVPGSTPAYQGDTRDGFIEPNGRKTKLFQKRTVTSGQHYRVSTWLVDNFMIGRLRTLSPATGTTYCGTSSNFLVPVSCEFTATATELMSFELQGEGGAGFWTVSDDWALTTVVKPPRNTTPTWPSLPVTYYGDSNSYTTRTDIATSSWNSAMGKQMLQRTSNINTAKIRIEGVNLGTADDFGRWFKPSPPSRPYGVIQINKDYLDQWKDPPYRFGFEAREGIIAHEFGHALGFSHVSSNNCQLMQPGGAEQTWFCGAFRPTEIEVDAMDDIYP